MRHGRLVTQKPRSSRLGFLAFLGLLVALVAGYLNDCFSGLGLPALSGTTAPKASEAAAPGKSGEGRARVVVTGETCRVGDAAAAGDCAAACQAASGAAVEIEATAGAQGTVDALRSCLQKRGLKVHVVSE